MKQLSSKLDHSLLALAWSLWTELGVAGHERKHQHCLVMPEELVLLTVMIGEIDPRLRDESLDWCSQYHNFISVSRLKSLLKDFDDTFLQKFSKYAATLNAIAPKAAWPVFFDLTPTPIVLSRKSCMKPLESPALLNIRARAIFRTGASADLVTFFLTQKQEDFAVSDLIEIGYSKRTLSEILDDFSFSGLFDKFMVRNQNRYRLKKNDALVEILKPTPQFAPQWRLYFRVILSLRKTIYEVKSKSESSQIVEIRNALIAMENPMQRLNISPPLLQTDFKEYVETFGEWILGVVSNIANGKF